MMKFAHAGHSHGAHTSTGQVQGASTTDTPKQTNGLMVWGGIALAAVVTASVIIALRKLRKSENKD